MPCYGSVPEWMGKLGILTRAGHVRMTQLTLHTTTTQRESCWSSGSVMGLKEPGSEGRATDRDPGENTQIQPDSQGDTPPVTDHAWPSTQCEISNSHPQMLPLCQLLFSVKQQ